ncbi:MAG: ISAs1 family transposase [Chloroflexi bacterium]|nr:ISAs1 family transposase [Chloroflexota bacterium]
MQYKTPSASLARPSGTSVATPSPIRALPVDLFAAIASVPDPRRRQGVRFPLPAVLALAAAAILCNHLSVLAIAEWGTSQSADLLRTLGFRKGVSPHQTTLQRLFAKINPDHLSIALSGYFGKTTSSPQGRPHGSQGVAIDGKAQRGRLAFDSSGCPVHALSALLHDLGIVLAHEPIENHGPNDKAEAELTVAPALIGRIDWQGRVMTADALLCQRNLCQQVLQAKGDYLLTVKENQHTLYEDIRLLFDPPLDTLPLDDRREAQTMDNGHGRHNDTRRLIASTDAVGYINWPGLAQVFRLERSWEEHGETKREVQYGITSLPPKVADPARLLELKRGHWQIENRLHYIKDVTLGEDRSLIHRGNGASVMALLRDLAISLLRHNGHRAIAPRLRSNSRHPSQAVALIIGVAA